jgi:hypothetical protein
MKQETLATNKSQLAKLMANENITVRHRPTLKTAKFDMKNRVLHCPIWQDMDGNIYDLLMGHEISHALNTPLLGWHDTITSDIKDKTRPKIKGFLNIVEDARIEKLVKRKYPGLRRPFADAYKTLFERDIFKVAKLKGDYSKLRLIDRINLYFKVGAHLNIQFDKEEQKYVDRAEALETFEDAAQLARDLYDYAKNKEPEKEKKKEEDKKNPPKKKKKSKNKPQCKPEKGDDKGDEKGEGEKSPDKKKPGKDDDGDDDSGGDDTDIHNEDKPEDGDGEPQDSDGDDEGDDSSGGGDDDDSDDADPEDGDEDGSGGNPDDSGDDSDPEDGDGDDSGDPDNGESEADKGAGKDAGRNQDNTPLEEPEAATDDAFREQEKELVNEQGEGILYLDLPKPDLSKIIVPHKMVVGKYELAINAQMINSGDHRTGLKAMNYAEVANGLNAAFHKRNKGFIAMLVKEFEMRKNANQYARQLTAKTGELDDKRIARYKLTNDIFRKITTITKGKSHGMIMFLDFSGSMSNIMREILEQVLVLVSFCKRIGIPFDVYGFGDSHSYAFGAGHHFMWETVNGGFSFEDDSFCLRHLISSQLTGNAYKRAFTMTNVIGQISNANERDPESNRCFNKPDYQGNIYNCGYELGGTPFNETLVASKTIIEKFKKVHHVDITNVIYLSDGDGYGSILNGSSYGSVPPNERGRTRIGVRDFATKLGVLTDNTTAVPFQTALTRLVALTTDCRHIGYFFGTGHEIARKVAQNSDLHKNLAQHLKFLQDNGFLAVENLGYDNYYYVNKDMTTYRGELKFYPQTDTALMGKKFIEHQNKKMNSKLIIKEFAADIAE